MFADTDEFLSIKITSAGTNPKVVPVSLELANKKNAERIKRVENKRTLQSIADEDLNEEDIESLYGTGTGVQAKLKIDRKKADIERRRLSLSIRALLEDNGAVEATEAPAEEAAE